MDEQVYKYISDKIKKDKSKTKKTELTKLYVFSLAAFCSFISALMFFALGIYTFKN